MSDDPGGEKGLDRLLEIARHPRSSEGVGERLSDELSELIEQLQAENEELQRSRDEIERLHRQFADLYEYAPVGYLVLNERSIIVQANETARDFLGAGSIDLERTALGPFIYRDCRDAYFKALWGCRAGGGAVTTEICIEKEEHFLWLQARISCDTYADGTAKGFRIVLTDITERVAAEQRAEERRLEVEQLLEEKELLLKEIHHRVKNDLHLVTTFLSLQGAGSGNPEVKAAMEEARSRVSIMARIYQALHRQSLYTQVDASSVVEEIIAGIRGGVSAGNVTVLTELEAVQVSTATSLSLGLILNELLTNAAKYALKEVEDPALSVSLMVVDGDSLELQVADNGPGMPDKVINGSSRGFGLSIAEAMAKQHRGSLTIENDAGAIVRVTLQCG